MIRLACIVLALAAPAFAQTVASCLQTPGVVCKTGDTMTGPLAFHAQILTPTGTIANTASSQTVTGTGTHFTTELTVGDAISPTTAGGVYFVIAIADDTHLTIIPGGQGWTAQAFTYAHPETVWQNMAGVDRNKFLAGGGALFNATVPNAFFTFAAPNSPAYGATTASFAGATGMAGSGTVNGTIGSTALTIVNGTGGAFTSGTGHSGGAGAGLLFAGGSGGAISATDTAAGNTGGGGGAWTIRGGTGGQVTAGTGNTGGVGGQATLLGGTGGAAIASNTNGSGGVALVDGGVAGAGAGTAGTPGAINIGTQNFGFTTIGAGLAFSNVISPAQITADQNDYNPTGLDKATGILIDLDADHNMTGITGGVGGRILNLYNTSTHDLTLQTENIGSTAANRFAQWRQVSFILEAKTSVLLRYDGTNLRWRIIGQYGIRTASPLAGAGIPTNGIGFTTSGYNTAAQMDSALIGLASGNMTALGMVAHQANNGLTSDFTVRTITQGAGITVTNGDGVAGNPTIAANNLVIKVDILAAGCNNATSATAWDLPTSTPAGTACSGTSTTTGFLGFADGVTTAATNHLDLPTDWTATGGVDLRLLYTGTTPSTNNIRWQVSTACVGDGEDLAAPSYNTASAANVAGPATGGQRKSTTFTGVAITNCAAGETMYLRVERVGGDGGDTYTGDAHLLSVEVTYRRTA